MAATIFYLDLLSGPDTGGESSRGTILSIYGKGFGATQGGSTVTVGGGSSGQHIYSWSDTKVVLGIGSGAATGDVVVTVGGEASICGNPLSGQCSFTVRSGNIYFVSGSGNDSTGDGSFSTPWRTLAKARDEVVAGDIVYAMTGSDATANDGCGRNAALSFSGSAGCSFVNSGTAANPVAFIVYPGHTVTIGSTDSATCVSCTSGLYLVGSTGTTYLTFAGFDITSPGGGALRTTQNAGNNVRFIANRIYNPYGDTNGGAAITAMEYTYFFGNEIYETGILGDICSKQQHQLYVQNNYQWIGWNTLRDNYQCRGIQVFREGQTGKHDIYIWSNIIYGDACAAITLGNVNPDGGPVRVWNNLIYRTGNGKNPDGLAPESTIWAGIYSADSGAGTWCGTCTGTIDIFNNTIVDIGSGGGPDSNTVRGAIGKDGSNTGILLSLKNNLVYQTNTNLVSPATATYYLTSTGTGQISGSDNLWFGLAISAPSQTTDNVTTDPQFVSYTPATTTFASHDFHIQAGSPAVGAGIDTALVYDLDGLYQNPRIDIGAYVQSEDAPPAGTPELSATVTANSEPWYRTNTGKTFSIVVTNNGDAATDETTVTTTIFYSTGLTITGLSGTGWTCDSPGASPLECTRTDALAASASYATITLTATVDSNAPATVSASSYSVGGGSAQSGTASDSVSLPETRLAPMKSA